MNTVIIKEESGKGSEKLSTKMAPVNKKAILTLLFTSLFKYSIGACWEDVNDVAAIGLTTMVADVQKQVLSFSFSEQL